MLKDSFGVRKALIATACAMNEARINVNKSGNVSVRVLNECGIEGFLITPTGIAYSCLTEEDLVFMPLGTVDLSQSTGKRLPSSEWMMHARVYETKPDVNAIVHTHSVYATALACHGKSIPAFHYMVATAGGIEIPCAPYRTFGTVALAEVVSETLASVKACLLSHHGVVATGDDLGQALRMAIEVENLAQCYCIAQSLGPVPLLSEQEMLLNLEKFKTYGAQR